MNVPCTTECVNTNVFEEYHCNKCLAVTKCVKFVDEERKMSDDGNSTYINQHVCIACSSCQALLHYHVKHVDNPSVVLPIEENHFGIMAKIFTSERTFQCFLHHERFKFKKSISKYGMQEETIGRTRLICAVCHFELFDLMEGMSTGDLLDGSGFTKYSYVEEVRIKIVPQ